MITTHRRSAPWAGPYTAPLWDAAVGKWAWVTPNVWARCVAVRYGPDGAWVELDWADHEQPDGSPAVETQGRLF